MVKTRSGSLANTRDPVRTTRKCSALKRPKIIKRTTTKKVTEISSNKGGKAKNSKAITVKKCAASKLESNTETAAVSQADVFKNVETPENVEEEVVDEDGPISEVEYESNHVWSLVDSYFEENPGLQSQAIASYNNFMNETLPNILKTCGKMSVEETHDSLNKKIHSLELLECYLENEVRFHSHTGESHQLLPHEARSRNLSYTSVLAVDIRQIVKGADALGYENVITDKIYKKVPIADIPIMVKSQFCVLNGMDEKELAIHKEDPLDPGGYFIINGKEKVVMTQERPANNSLFLFKPMCDSDYQYECELRSTINSSTNKVSALWIHIPGNPKSYKTFKDGGRLCKVGGTRYAASKSLNDPTVKTKEFKKFFKSRPGLIVTIASVREKIPLLIFFKALGFESDEEIYKSFLVGYEDMDFFEALRSTMENREARFIKTQEDALHYIGVRSIKQSSSRAEVIIHAEEVICEEVLPALGTEKLHNRVKGYHIGYMVNRLIYAYLGRIPCDDRDHLKNKRFDLAGPLLATLFKSQVKNLMSEAKYSIVRRLDRGLDYDVTKNVIRQKLITRNIMYSMTTGNWGDKRRGSTCRTGVVQLLNRVTGVASISYLRRINSPFNRLLRMTAPRQVHTTAFGYVCPADSPEGETVGLLKTLSVMAEISVDYGEESIIDILRQCGYLPIAEFPENLALNTKIIINSKIVGSCPAGSTKYIMMQLQKGRRDYKDNCLLNSEHTSYIGFPPQVSITYDCELKEIRIRTDGGRAFRPLLVVKNNELVLRRKHIQRLLDVTDYYSWKNLIEDGVVEYLDAAESETALIAMFPQDLSGKNTKTYITKSCSRSTSYSISYTHCEIHPSMILGVCASLIPYPDHNQSPRNTYQSGMAKQAIGVYQMNFSVREDPEAHVLHYPQRPLITTKTSKFIRYDENPAGVNAIAAICCFTGYNQEDSIILSSSALDRGFFRSTMYKTKTDEARRCVGRGDTDETFELPRRGEVNKFRNSDYTNLDEDGFPPPGCSIEDNQPLIAKTKCIEPANKNRRGRPAIWNVGINKEPWKSDISMMFRSSSASHTSYVDSVMITDSPDGYRMVKVKIRTPRIPQIGDKFASRHGQKGVVGMCFSEEDMPFTKDGVVPDVILNPHAIPSRMTIGHLIETLASKRGALAGKMMDGTCFTKRLSVEELGKELEKFNFHKYGQEVMFNGATGRKQLNQIFIGPVFYQRLKHMTEDKLHIRARGPVTELCRQPNAGLQRDGGLKFGEMEKDSLVAHGASSFLRERLFVVSDFYNIMVCKGCGSFLSRKLNIEINRHHVKCRLCAPKEPGVTTAELPYACKLFFQELMAMNIRVQIISEGDSKGLSSKAFAETPPVGQTNLLSNLIRKMNQEALAD